MKSVYGYLKSFCRIPCNTVPNPATRSQVIPVPSRRLSDFILGPVDLLKLDVEGAEYRVLCDLLSSGEAQSIKQIVIEYHHRMENERSCLTDFLRQLEQAGFEYQIHASLFPVTSKLRRVSFKTC